MIGEHDLSQFWSLLFEIVTDVEKRLAAHMAAHQLTPPQFYVLKTLVERSGGCPIGEIARAQHLTNATMTGLVKRLEAMQPPLVIREPSTLDRRSVMVTLTDTGRERFLSVQYDLLVQVGAMLSLLDDQGRQNLYDYASRYVNEVTRLFPVTAIAEQEDA